MNLLNDYLKPWQPIFQDFSVSVRLCPKKGVWNFQALTTPAFISAWRVPDTFFLGKAFRAKMTNLLARSIRPLAQASAGKALPGRRLLWRSALERGTITPPDHRASHPA